MISRRISFALVALLLPAALLSCARGPVVVQYYHSSLCHACDESRRALAGGASLSGRSIDVRTYDVVATKEASDAYFAVLARLGVPEKEQRLPLLVVGDKYYVGSEDVNRSIRELLGRKP